MKRLNVKNIVMRSIEETLEEEGFETRIKKATISKMAGRFVALVKDSLLSGEKKSVYFPGLGVLSQKTIPAKQGWYSSLLGKTINLPERTRLSFKTSSLVKNNE